MFTDFLFALRKRGLPVGTQEWLALHQALGSGLLENSDDLYGLGRAILVHNEAHYDDFDLAFLEVFHDVEAVALSDAIAKWLENPIAFEGLSPEAFQQLTGLSLDELRRRFEEMLQKQKERHDGGSRYIGTGGTSPFGHGGAHPTGLRVGGPGGGRMAVQVAGERRFRNYRSDVTIDVRQFRLALRALRNLGREGPEELDVDETIDRTCDDGGEIHLAFRKERRNTVRLLLLMDAGGSMTPYARLVDRLFTAASEMSHWKSLDHYFFHNVPYGRVYRSIERLDSVPTADLFRVHPKECKVVFVGDACMAPWELMATGGALGYGQQNAVSGFDRILRFHDYFDDVVWLNPEPQRYWGHETISTIRRAVPMFPLSLDGLRDMVRHLRKGAVNRKVG